MADVKIEVLDNGPYIVEGAFDLVSEDGTKIEVPAGRKFIALCRCGGSTNLPFCDGTHSKIGFQGARKAVIESEQK